MTKAITSFFSSCCGCAACLCVACDCTAGGCVAGSAPSLLPTSTASSRVIGSSKRARIGATSCPSGGSDRCASIGAMCTLFFLLKATEVELRRHPKADVTPFIICAERRLMGFRASEHEDRGDSRGESAGAVDFRGPELNRTAVEVRPGGDDAAPCSNECRVMLFLGWPSSARAMSSSSSSGYSAYTNSENVTCTT